MCVHFCRRYHTATYWQTADITYMVSLWEVEACIYCKCIYFISFRGMYFGQIGAQKFWFWHGVTCASARVNTVMHRRADSCSGEKQGRIPWEAVEVKKHRQDKELHLFTTPAVGEPDCLPPQLSWGLWVQLIDHLEIYQSLLWLRAQWHRLF